MKISFKTKIAFGVACAAALGALAVPAYAQFAKSEDAIKYRQAVFTLQGNHLARLGAMAKGEKPFNAAEAKVSADFIAELSKMPWEAFPVGSGGAPAKLKADPWASAAEFKGLQDKFIAEAAKLPAAVATLDGLRAQVGATGGSCKNCHDKYRGQ